MHHSIWTHALRRPKSELLMQNSKFAPVTEVSYHSSLPKAREADTGFLKMYAGSALRASRAWLETDTNSNSSSGVSSFLLVPFW